MSSSLKYINISEEDINQVCFNSGGCKEFVIVHEFTKNDVRDYVVLGKLKDMPNVLSGVEYVEWLVNIRKLIKNYKTRDTPNNFNFDKFLKSNITSNILFTKEGYDLITNKFKYLNNELDRTVKFKTSCREGRLLYEPPADANVLSNRNFHGIEYLQNHYFFTKEQVKKIERINFIKYVKANFNKINNIPKTDPNFSGIVKGYNNPDQKIDFIMQYIAINAEGKEKEYSKAIR